jgi:hypothetical protein
MRGGSASGRALGFVRRSASATRPVWAVRQVGCPRGLGRAPRRANRGSRGTPADSVGRPRVRGHARQGQRVRGPPGRWDEDGSPESRWESGPERGRMPGGSRRPALTQTGGNSPTLLIASLPLWFEVELRRKPRSRSTSVSQGSGCYRGADTAPGHDLTAEGVPDDGLRLCGSFLRLGPTVGRWALGRR